MSYIDKYMLHWVLPATEHEIIRRIRESDGWPGASLGCLMNGVDKNGCIFIQGTYHRRTVIHRTIAALLGTVPDDYRQLNLMMRHTPR